MDEAELRLECLKLAARHCMLPFNGTTLSRIEDAANALLRYAMTGSMAEQAPRSGQGNVRYKAVEVEDAQPNS